MQQKELEIKVKPNGEFSIETFGTEGTECSKIVEQVVNYIGGNVSEDTKKDEYWKKPQNVYENVG